MAAGDDNERVEDLRVVRSRVREIFDEEHAQNPSPLDDEVLAKRVVSELTSAQLVGIVRDWLRTEESI
jgi:hypothetical protein